MAIRFTMSIQMELEKKNNGIKRNGIRGDMNSTWIPDES